MALIPLDVPFEFLLPEARPGFREARGSTPRMTMPKAAMYEDHRASRRKFSRGEEQALLARVRYNRLIDIFLGITAASLQNHLRTKIPNYGQIEIDELYVGIDARGAQFIVPVQAKGGKDKLGVIQTIQDTIYCQTTAIYANAAVRPVSAQFIPGERGGEPTIAMFELDFDGDEVSIRQERHYKLVRAAEVTAGDLEGYRRDPLIAE